MMGEEACRDCRSWQEEIYWNHFQCIHFSQFLHAGFDQHLVIPEKFSSNLRKKLPDSVILRGPSGGLWEVGVLAKDDTLLFNLGWEEFVRDHALQEKDILMFKYNGDSQFDVLIFDRQTMCEKETSYFIKKCGHKVRSSGFLTAGKYAKDSVEVLTPPWAPETRNSDVDSTPLTSFKKQKHIAYKNGFHAHKENVKNSVVLVAPPGEAGGSSKVERCPTIDVDAIPLGVATQTLVAKKRTRRVNGDLCAKQSLSNSKQPSGGKQPSDGDLELETDTKERTPYSTKKLNDKRSRVKKKTPSTTPKDLECEAAGAGSQVDTAIDVDKIPLGVPTLTMVGKKRARRVIEALCAKQSLANSKQPSAGDLELETVTKEITPYSTKKLGSKRSSVKKKTPSPTPKNPELEADVENLGENTVNISTPIASYRSSVTEEQKSMAMQLALDMLSKDGFFVVMKPTSVRKRFFMSIPSAWFSIHLTSLEHQDMILRRDEKTWTTRFYYQEARKSGGISSGWKHFVEDNNLHEHDVCVFEPVSLEDRPFVFDVTIVRAVPNHGPVVPASE